MSNQKVHRCEALSLNDRTVVNNGDGWILVKFERGGGGLPGDVRGGPIKVAKENMIVPMQECTLSEPKCPYCQADLERR